MCTSLSYAPYPCKANFDQISSSIIVEIVSMIKTEIPPPFDTVEILNLIICDILDICISRLLSRHCLTMALILLLSPLHC